MPSRCWLGGREIDRVGVRHRLVPEHGDQLCQRGHPQHLDPVDQLGFPGLPVRHDDSAEPACAAASVAGSTPRHRTDPTVQPELAEQHRVPQLDRLHHVRGRQHGRHDGQVVAAPLLRQGGRGEVDRQQGVRPGLLAAVHRRLAPVPGLVQRGVRQPDQDRARQPGTGVGLHLDDPTVESDQRDRVRARETHWSPIPVTCTSNGFWSCCSSTPMASSRIPSTGSGVLAHPLRRELAQPPDLGARDGLQRVAVVASRAALDLAEHDRPPTVAAVKATTSSSPQRHDQLRSRISRPCCSSSSTARASPIAPISLRVRRTVTSTSIAHLHPKDAGTKRPG